jgi:hypothetical protein
MNYRLLVNPGTPQAWEIQLKPGVNRIGRNEENDFTINHTSVSGSHCEITVSADGVFLKDLGSTNGTFVNRAPVREVWLQPGQHVQFGPVDMTFESASPTPAAPAGPTIPPIPIPIPVPVPGSIRPPMFAPASNAQPTSASDTGGAGQPEEQTETLPGPTGFSVPVMDAGDAACKSHPKTPARYRCHRCQKYFCDLCVTTRGVTKYCRTCGQALAPLRTHAPHRVAEPGFFGRLPGAAVYPFKGSGLLVLIAASIIFSLLEAITGGFMFIFYFLIKLMAIGYLYSFMQNIIHATAAEEAEMPELPGFDGVFAACFRLIAVVLLCYGPPIIMEVANWFGADLPVSAIIATKILGCLYFPMAFLAVAMKDNVMAANPLVVIPAILKVPAEYLVAAILLAAIFGLRLAGDDYAQQMGRVSLTTRRMDRLFMSFGVRALWSFASVYLLTVNMRILGLLYVTKKQKLGWFAR